VRGQSTAHDEVGGAGQGSRWQLPPISLPEKIGAVMLLSLLVIVGLYPSVMLDMITVNVDLFLGGLP